MKAIKLSDLTPDPNNANKGTVRGRGLLEKSLQDLGAGRSVLADKHGVLIAGNKTLQTAIESGFEDAIVVESDGTKLIVVKRTDLDLSTDEKAKLLAIADNRVGEISLEWSPEVLAELSQEVDLSGFFFPDELDALLASEAPDPVATAEEDEATAADLAEQAEAGELESRVSLGQIWSCGRHRVACGDSTVEANVKGLLGDRLIDICITSPPYNSGIGGYKSDYNGKQKRFYKEDSDHRSPEEWVDFCCSTLNAIALFCRDETPVLWNVMYTAKTRSQYGEVVFGDRHPFTVRETICWDKGNGFPTATKGILSRNWELIFVLAKSDKYFTTQGENEVRWGKWDIPREKQHKEHAATFPAALPLRAFGDFSLPNSLGYDPFLGSGSTLIAAQQMEGNRSVYGFELSEAYCEVILRRWEALTGKTATLVGNL